MSLPSLPRRAAFLPVCCALLLGAAFTPAALVADDLPTPSEIIARFVEAIGGEDALRAYTSATSKGAFEMPAMGMSGEATEFSMAPDKTLARINLPGMGETVQGYNGAIGWAEDPMQGARLLEGEMLAQARREARFYAQLEYAELFPEQTTAGETEWNDQVVYQVDLVDTDGNESSHFFAKDTGLMIGMEATMTNEMGTADMSVNIGEYKDFGGIMIPTSTVMNLMGMEMIQTIESVTWNDVDPSVFEPSDSIKALLPE